ncbi:MULTISPECIES: sporulation protein YqfD [Sporosarcina]|uniref:Similar to stage IV sporulation protein n=1 Tax=Sporosarcina newyorkensis TaxID=759851 RepID=A0A1T4XG44_9BACL|nr:sporulation protein YqfD [Sporosarcina newyorkensis]SKA88178.1 similar to stage IV sporulation protein [Sporosarcina newyorkensis]
MSPKRFEVQLTAVGGTSSFLGKLQVEQVKIKNLYVAGRSVYFETDSKGIQTIRRFRKKYHVKVKVSHIGNDTVNYRLFSSFLFIIGCMLPLCASLFLWNIEVESEVPELAERMELKMEKANIRVPSLLSKLPEEDEIRRLLMQDESSLSWIRFKKMGTSLIVSPMLAPLSAEVKEDKKEKPSHLVAKTGGVITHFALTRGERASIVHQTVKKGDMLATGILEQGEKTTVVGADGEVFADYWLEYHFELPRTVKYSTQGEEQVNINWRTPWHESKEGVFRLRNPILFKESREDPIHTVRLEKGMEETVILPLLKHDLLSKKTDELVIKEENILHVSFTNDKVSGTLLFLINENIAEKRPITQGD